MQVFFIFLSKAVHNLAHMFDNLVKGRGEILDLQAVTEIGNIEKQKLDEKGGGLLEVFAEDPSDGGKYNHVFEIVVDIDNVIYKHINVTQFDSKDMLKYLYRMGSSAGADLTPTAKITKAEKTFSNKILASIKETLQDKSLSENFKKEAAVLDMTYGILKRAQEQIIADIDKLLKDLPTREGAFLTLRIEKKGNKHYVGDYQIFKRKLIDSSLLKFHYSKSFKTDLIGYDSVCSLCRKNKKEVFGLANIFPFYTIDKKGYISGGFQYDKAWMNFPVCPECSILLVLGKSYLDKNLTFSFKGLNYYLIPNTIYSGQLEYVLKKLKGLNEEKEYNFVEKYLAQEERILINAGKELKENSISFELLFFKKDKAALNILLDIQDVMPSRLRKIYETFSEVNEEKIFKKFYLSTDKQQQIFINFGFVRTIFPRDTHNGYFLETINDIISDKKIDYKFLLKPIVAYITDAFKRMEKGITDKNKDNYLTATIKSFGFLYYLNRMNLIRERKEAGPVKTKSNVWKKEDFNSEREMFEDFFNTYSTFFDVPEKKVCFLEGYLTKKLLNIQYNNDKRTPFLARLKGLKLTKKDMERLFPEIQNKLTEYNANYYRETEELISSYFIEAGNSWSIPDLDVPFYFSLGMNMASIFIIKKEKEDHIDD
ncbi:MAG: CRISPR-associated protein Csh1 [Clostridia bacterium]|nr:CRISPR-associated protein Csh1 [Clostridia bacterium]